MNSLSLREEIESNVVVAPNGCWLWELDVTAANPPHGAGGYAVLRGKSAYRLAYEEFVGPIPAGLELDHLCRQRDCVNWRHLEPVTHAENMRRARKKYCKYGHERTQSDVAKRPTCRTCGDAATTRWIYESEEHREIHRTYAREHYRKNRVQILAKLRAKRQEARVQREITSGLD